MKDRFFSPFRGESRQTAGFRQRGDWSCGYHTGVDRVTTGDPTVLSVFDGRVLGVNCCGGAYGNHIVVSANGVTALYAHLKRKPAYSAGETIAAGDVVGVMGSSGRSSGAHLHIEFQRSDEWAYARSLIDPDELVDWDRHFEKADGEPWLNGSTAEPVYRTTDDCRRGVSRAGSLTPGERARKLTESDGCVLLEYGVEGSVKCGYVRFKGVKPK